jgi:hypothetical protein
MSMRRSLFDVFWMDDGLPLFDLDAREVCADLLDAAWGVCEWSRSAFRALGAPCERNSAVVAETRGQALVGQAGSRASRDRRS